MHARQHELLLTVTWHFSFCLISCRVSKQRSFAFTWKEELSHLPPASFPLSCSLIQHYLLTALVPSARLIDQKASECSSMFDWIWDSQSLRIFFFHPGFPRPSDTFSHTPRLSLLHSRSDFFIVAPLFYIPLHFNTYTVGNNPDSISHKRKNDIYVQREGGKAAWPNKEEKKRV